MPRGEAAEGRSRVESAVLDSRGWLDCRRQAPRQVKWGGTTISGMTIAGGG